MWVHLNKTEIAEILMRVGPGAIADKLTEQAHPEAELFREAAMHDDYTKVPVDAPVDRTRNGAYVLSWRWIYNETVGLMDLTDFDDYEISQTSRARIEAIREFQADYVDLDGDTEVGEGLVDKAYWRLTSNGDLLTFAVFADVRAGQDIWSTSEVHANPTLDSVILFLASAVERYRASTA
ncbi:hypothetical protein ACCS45_03870 [Rhizobium ruizarguesonis]